jgi:hypothetical protein
VAHAGGFEVATGGSALTKDELSSFHAENTFKTEHVDSLMLFLWYICVDLLIN